MTAAFHTLEQKIERLHEQIIRLEEIKKEIHSVSDLEDDFRKEAIVERLFQIALEALLDIGRMIISLENLPRPEENDDIFRILAKAQIVSEKFAKRAFGIGGFRNILVHGYMIIKPQKVFENLEKIILLKEFLSFGSKYLEKKISK